MRVALAGKAVTLTFSNADRNLIETFMSNDDAEVFCDLHDKCKKSLVVQGVFDDQVQLLVDGEPWNGREGVVELMNDFPLMSYPMHELLNEEIKSGTYWFITKEIESGSFFAIDIEDFDESKLILSRRVFEMPNGDELRLVTAQYDGRPLDYDGPDIESIENILCDSDGHQLGQ